MFHKVFIEEEIAQHHRTKKILSQIKPNHIEYIERYNQVWGKVKRPYLQKRQDLNLFIAQKRGNLVKLAPDAYGQIGAPHYYFIHSFNCIYECEYCYLQGYFHTPDLVFFINHEEILQEIKRILQQHEQGPVWFHGGEFSDSLALSHITQELELYFDFFAKHPQANLELRSKSANIQTLMRLSPSPNIVIGYSLSPQNVTKSLDQKTPPLKTRIEAIKKIAKHGHQVAIHLDPIVDSPSLKRDYEELIDSVVLSLPLQQLAYLSLGVVRFTPSVYSQVQNNYPKSKILKQEFTKSRDGKIRYSRPHRNRVLESIKKICLRRNIPPKKIYLCME